MIGLANFQRQWESAREQYLAAVERVGKSGWLILGEEVAHFEADFARFSGSKYAVGCASGLDALELALRCAGLTPGEFVLTTPLSAFATTLAIVRAGGVPVFADVDASGQLDFASAEAALRRLEPRARFMVPVHLYGHAINLEALSAFAKREKLIVIEDCAQAVGARSNGQCVGGVSPVWATSFYPTKNLGAFGDGGALLTNDESVRDRARQLRDYGQSAKYLHAELGLNSRLDELHAAIMRSVQLPGLAAHTSRRAAIAARYRSEIRHAAIRHVEPPDGSESVWHLFPVLCRDRDALALHLRSSGVATAVHYPKLIPDQPAMASTRWLSIGPLPRAQQFANEELSLPLHPFLTDAEVEQVITACMAWVASK
jgi:dTDP-4-amino-4,6-dideoxygalactose transaminase